MGIKSKRVDFTFDPEAVKTAEQIARENGSNSIHDTVRESLHITRAATLQIRQFDGSLKPVIMPPRFRES